MPVELQANPSKFSLISGVLSFVSKEFEHFVASAARSPTEPSAVDVFSDEEGEEYDEQDVICDEPVCKNLGTRSPPRKRTKVENVSRWTPTPEERPRQRNSPGRICVRSRRKSDGQLEHGTQHSPSPRPLPRAIKRSSSISMPGSLFPRSPSIEPDTSATEREQRVRFASRTLDSPAPHFSPRKSGSSFSSESGSSTTTLPCPSTPRRPKHSDSVKAAVARFQDDADPHILLPNSKSSPHALGHTENRIDKGKGRAVECFELNISRMKGKEKELVAARQELDRTERRLESGNDVELYPLEETERGRNRDKEKIRALEEEIERLKQELKKRQTFDDYLPPPPPPPPPPPKSLINGPRKFLESNNALFASARASLRPAPIPIENPINPLTSLRRSVMPTVGIAPDKMAAFLNEMKTVRLRRVSASSGLESVHSSTTNLSVSDLTSRSISMYDPSSSKSSIRENLSTSEIESHIGEKRKRTLTGPQVVPLRRRSGVSSVESSTATNSTFNLPSQHYTDLSIGPSLSQSYPFPTTSGRSWPSSSTTDAPTPSLCSDNEGERDETSPDDQPPSTPPAIIGPSRAFFRFKGNGIRVESESSRRTSDGVRASHSISEEFPLNERFNVKRSVFDKRPPTSPLPEMSPRRPCPPSRKAQHALLYHSTPINAPISDDEDPLSLTFPSPECISQVSKPQRDRGSLDSNRDDGFSDWDKLLPPTSVSLSRPASRARSHRSASHSNRPNRRLTLDEELRNAFELQEDNNAYDDQDEVLAGVGTRSNRTGFLPGGGAAGAPVFMGVGYVEGAEESEDDTKEEQAVCD